jgi:hypothetical protein
LSLLSKHAQPNYSSADIFAGLCGSTGELLMIPLPAHAHFPLLIIPLCCSPGRLERVRQAGSSSIGAGVQSPQKHNQPRLGASWNSAWGRVSSSQGGDTSVQRSLPTAPTGASYITFKT